LTSFNPVSIGAMGDYCSRAQRHKHSKVFEGGENLVVNNPAQQLSGCCCSLLPLARPNFGKIWPKQQTNGVTQK